MADGSLMFDTTVDTSGFSQGSSKITKEAEKAADNVSAEVNETSQKIQAILDDTTRSMKSKAMSISAIYRAQGLEQSEAMQKAWSHIERGSADANDDILNDTKKTHKKICNEYNNTRGEAVDSFKSTLLGVKSILGKMAAAVAAAFSIGALINFGKQAVTIASDVQEVQNVVDTAFGEMAYKMETFADTAIESFGISRLSAKQTGSTLMSMAKGMGIANDSASDMAVTLTGLSADMASFYNVSQDVASTALKSIFTGETETLKQFGIVMTEANLQAFALSQGITKNVSAMTQAEKVQLRYAYVMQQTSLAQGDFAKTSNSWANQTRILAEQWKEFSSIIGTVLVNVLTPAVKTLNSILSQLIVSARNAAAVLSDIFGFDLSQNFSFAADSGTAADNYADIANSAEDAAKATERQLMGFDEINKLSGDSGDSGDSAASGSVNFDSVAVEDAEKTTSESVGKIKIALEELSGFFKGNFGADFLRIWDDFSEQLNVFKENIENVFGDVKQLAEPFRKYISEYLIPNLQTNFSILGSVATGLFDTYNTAFSDIWNLAVYPMLQNFVTVGLPLITSFNTQTAQSFQTLFNTVKSDIDILWQDVARPALSGISTIWNDTWLSMQSAWEKWGTPVFQKIDESIENTSKTFRQIWQTTLKPVWDKFCQTADTLWNNHLKPLVDNFLDLVGTFVDGGLRIYNEFIVPFLRNMNILFGPTIRIAFSTALNVIKTFFGGMFDYFNSFITKCKGVIRFVTGVLTADWSEAWEGIKTIFKGIWDSFVAIVKTPINLIIDLLNGMVSSVESALNGIINEINTLSWEVPDWVPSIGGETFGFDIDNISIPEIPHLATGTVVPANFGEFAAILGDNKREPEIVSPYSIMMQAFKDALSEMNSGKTEIIKLVLDGKTVSEVVRRYNTRNTRATNGGTI